MIGERHHNFYNTIDLRDLGTDYEFYDPAKSIQSEELEYEFRGEKENDGSNNVPKLIYSAIVAFRYEGTKLMMSIKPEYRVQNGRHFYKENRGLGAPE